MRYSAEPKYRKYVESYEFLSFVRKIWRKIWQKIDDANTKTGVDAAKTVSKRVVQKNVEATGDVIGNKYSWCNDFIR